MGCGRLFVWGRDGGGGGYFKTAFVENECITNFVLSDKVQAIKAPRGGSLVLKMAPIFMLNSRESLYSAV